MSPTIKEWGNNTWIFFHVLVSKLKEENSNNLEILNQILSNITIICSNLPCPNCTQHAKAFLSKIQPNEITSKEKLINLLFCFHNTVNTRKKKPIFKYEDLKTYENYNLAVAYNNFAKVYNLRSAITN